jgi:hypothetical protein
MSSIMIEITTESVKALSPNDLALLWKVVSDELLRRKDEANKATPHRDKHAQPVGPTPTAKP